MNMLKLNGTQSLGLEPDEKRVRLIVFKNGVEEVCRKEYPTKIKQFILSDATRLFKGRLQLVKNQESIGIEIKGAMAGYIKTGDFLNHLELTKNVTHYI